MSYENIKFIFLKTPQLRHRFQTNNENQIFPIIRHEVYRAKLVNETYQFFGNSFYGTVSEEDFITAIREGYVELIDE